MSTTRTIQLPPEVDASLRRAAEVTRRTPEQVAAEWLALAARLHDVGELRDCGSGVETATANAARAEYTTEVIRGLAAPIPWMVARDLGLRPFSPVKITLVKLPETAETERKRALLAGANQRLLEHVRDQLSGTDVSLTDALIQARDEEDATL